MRRCLTKTNFRGAVIPLALLAGAELAARVLDVNSDILAAPSAALIAGTHSLIDGELVQITFQTLLTLLGGLALGTLIGLFAGTFLGLFSILNRLMEFSIEVVRPIPSIALFPIALLAFGFGYRMEIAIVAFSTTWPVLILTRAAVSGVEPLLFDVARSLGLGLWGSITKIILPAMLPRLFVAFRLAAGVALIVAITVEIAGNPLGLGAAMMTAQQSLNPALGIALLFWVGLLGFTFNAALLWAQRRMFGQAARIVR